MPPYVVRGVNKTVEIWSGKRIQPGKETADTWQAELKNEVRESFLQLGIHRGSLLAGYYNTTSQAMVDTDTENSLFTNMNETMPGALFTALRFERGAGTPPPGPRPIDVVSGHLHYYRYTVGGSGTTWEPDQVVARWRHIPRRIAVGSDTARPVWFALRQANAEGEIHILIDEPLSPAIKFGIRINVHTTPSRSHQPTTNSEFVIDGAIAAFHNDPLSDRLTAALVPRLPGVTQADFRLAMRNLAGPLFENPSVTISATGAPQISPCDHRCLLGEYTVDRNSESRWLEVSGELFTIQPTTSSPLDR
jgi:hypothetical protein